MPGLPLFLTPNLTFVSPRERKNMSSEISSRRGLTLGLLVVVAILSYVDRQVFTLFQDDIKQELGLDDGQLGLLTGIAFAAFYALAAFPIARYADRGDRRLVIAVCVSIWSAATAVSRRQRRLVLKWFPTL